MVNYCRISVKESTYKKFKEIYLLIQKRNPSLEKVIITEDFAVNWLMDAYKERII
jgi:hypothetical protein